MRTPTGYAIPSDAPKPVEEAQAKLADVAARLQEIDDKIREAEAAVKTARQKDAERVCSLAVEGKPCDDPTKAERKALADVEAAKAGRPGVEMAVLKLAGEMIDTVRANVDTWENTLRGRLEAAHATFTEHIDAAVKATAELRSARAGLAWLDQSALHLDREVDNHRAHREFQQYTGSADLKIDGRLDANRQPDVTDLLSLARKLTAEPTPPPAPRSFETSTSQRGDGSWRIADPAAGRL